MNMFDKIIDTALENAKDYVTLRPVVEKELLHIDVLSEMNRQGLLAGLTFIGGTCLRKCYGSERLSEDLDFTGGLDFTKGQLATLTPALAERFLKKYGLSADVTEPVRETGDTDTWKIKVIMQQSRPDIPAQRINIDICKLPSYERRPMMLKNQYGIETGTSGLILYAESLEEILADKLIAIAFRPNRVKNRDVWDILWLSRQNIKLNKSLLEKKVADRGKAYNTFLAIYRERVNALPAQHKEFLFEMKRFLSPATFTSGDSSLNSPTLWEYIVLMLQEMKI
ncbi:nucleotidyl transferase AbiEii/AbiGii toxin family protein [Deferribacterales bacterium RsTz2092]|nr:nucleotidyltransferase [Deferribacterales bacterium]